MCNFNCKIRLQTFQMFLTKLKQKYKKIELLKNFCKNQIGFLQSLFLINYLIDKNINYNMFFDFIRLFICFGKTFWKQFSILLLVDAILPDSIAYVSFLK